MSEYEGFMRQVEEAKISIAKTALANPGMFPEAGALRAARQQLKAAEVELMRAELAWKRLILPAKGWAPDPLKE